MLKRDSQSENNASDGCKKALAGIIMVVTLFSMLYIGYLIGKTSQGKSIQRGGSQVESNFPHQLHPLIIKRTNARDLKMFQFAVEYQMYTLKETNSEHVSQLFKELFRKNDDSLWGQFSALHEVSVPQDAKETLRIDESATQFAWVYPAPLTPDAKWFIESIPATEYLTALDLILNGGFLYFDSHAHLLHINTLVPSHDDSADVTKMYFDKPQKWHQDWTQGLHRDGRFHDVTEPALRFVFLSMFIY